MAVAVNPNWQPTDERTTLLVPSMRLILFGNRQMNLTRITDPLEFWENGFFTGIVG